MEERKRILENVHLTEHEKDVLDEFILDIKNSQAIIPIHEENNRQKYDREKGTGASLLLLKNNLEYTIENGELDHEQIQKLNAWLGT
jgi:hypothetical protein